MLLIINVNFEFLLSPDKVLRTTTMLSKRAMYLNEVVGVSWLFVCLIKFSLLLK